MAAAWARAWWLKISSSAAPRMGAGRSLQPTTGITYSTGTSGTTTYSTSSCPTSPTPGSGPVQERSLEPVVEETAEEERVKKLEHIKALVVRFRSDRSTPERWLSELEVTWVLHLANVSQSGRSFISGQLLYLSRSWILALFEITEIISIYFGGWCSSEEDGPPASEFIRFVEATWSKMLPFVHAIVAGTKSRREPADEKLQALILVRDALSTASVQILSSFRSSPSCRDETRDILSAELLMAKLDEAIWNSVEETQADLFSWWDTPGSSNIHSITRAFIGYIKVLWANYGSVNRIIFIQEEKRNRIAFLRGEVVPDNEKACHLTNLTIEMVHSLERKLTRMSQSFVDPGIKFLFLINNVHFILQQLCLSGLPPMPELASKIDDDINSYIQVSWAPVLECLLNPTPHCFTRRSPLPKFESKFQETCTTQKLWKVPDPEIRKRMRGAIVEEVIPDYTEFLKDNTKSTPSITPQAMKIMLQQLFEG